MKGVQQETGWNLCSEGGGGAMLLDLSPGQISALWGWDGLAEG